MLDCLSLLSLTEERAWWKRAGGGGGDACYCYGMVEFLERDRGWVSEGRVGF